MTFQWGFPLAGVNDNKNTEIVLHDSSAIAALLRTHE